MSKNSLQKSTAIVPTQLNDFDAWPAFPGWLIAFSIPGERRERYSGPV